MKKTTLFTLFSCFSILLLVQCKKGSDNTFVPNKLTYQFNGQTFSDPNNGGPILDNYYRFIGIEMRDSVLPGVLKYYIFPSPSGCAYLVPQGLYFTLGPNCMPAPVDPADSSKVYLYRSGSINYSFSNCK